MTPQTLIRNSADRTGSYRYATPENTALRFLQCGWIRLDASDPVAENDSGSEELSLIVTNGSGIITVGGTDGEEFEVGQYDALLIPPGNRFTVRTDSRLDIAEAAAPSSLVGDPQFVSYEATLADPELTMNAGSDQYARKVIKLIDKNVTAERLLCGLTFGAPGNWTSWSPHEHASTREEVYLYIDMPKPAFGIQMVYNNLKEVDFIAPVFENDAVVITEGYHPNTGIPGYGINFVWMMAGLNPHTDREWAEMHWQEEFAGLYP